MTRKITTYGVSPPLAGPKLKAASHEPTRVRTPGPESHRFVSRSAPQIAHPAANGLTGSRQLGHRLRSGIADGMSRRPESGTEQMSNEPRTRRVENVWDYPRP